MHHQETIMKVMKRCCIPCSLLFALAFLSAGPAPADKGQKKDSDAKAKKGKSETIKLFNGKDLDGWEGYEDLWTVKDGVIVAKNTKPVAVSTYLLTKRKFSDFRLIFAAKLVESEMHSGVALWGKVNPSGSKDRAKVRGTYTAQCHLAMFPSRSGMYDVFGRNGRPVDGSTAKTVGTRPDASSM